MPAINLKKWHHGKGVYTSPMLPVSKFKQYKSHIIRAKLFAEFDDARHIIKIPINNNAAKDNEEKLQRLGWIKD